MLKIDSIAIRSRPSHRMTVGRTPLVFVSLVWWSVVNTLVLTAAAQNGSLQKGGISSPPEFPADHNATPRQLVFWPQNRYLCFSNAAILPPIRVSDDGKSIRVGTLGNLQLEQLPTLTPHKAKAVAGELGVPTGLVIRVAKAASRDPGKSPADVARQLRGAVIDFRFLLAELSNYHPSTREQPGKLTALLQLQDGDLLSVWRFYRELPWPQAPSQPRISSAQ